LLHKGYSDFKCLLEILWGAPGVQKFLGG